MAQISMEKPDKRLLGGHEMIRVAAIQAPQIVFNKEKSIEIACQKIKEAAKNGAKLAAFSESYIPVYASYYSSTLNSKSDEWAMWNVGLQKNSVVIPSDDTDRIGQACKEAGIYCVMGVNELDDADGVRTYYNTQIIFGSDGKILGRHRKLKPTYDERVYWGEGDGSDLGVYKTDIGRIGSLICWEHHTALVRVAQMLLGEEFHISNWPGTWKFHGQRMVEANYDPQAYGCDGTLAAREYAFEAGCFVISVHGLLREQDFEPEYRPMLDSQDLHFDWANGGSCIINPFGEFIASPVFDDDTIIYADCYANEIRAAKAFFDALGHYSRPSVAKLLVNTDHDQNLNLISNAGVSVPDYSKMKQISEQYEVELKKIEQLAAKMENSLK